MTSTSLNTNFAINNTNNCARPPVIVRLPIIVRPPVVVLQSLSCLIMLTITECPFCHKALPKTNHHRHFPHCLHANAKLPCDGCSKTVCVRDYPRYRMSCQSERIECKVCGKAISKSNMKRHSQNVHGVRKNKFSHCMPKGNSNSCYTNRDEPPLAWGSSCYLAGKCSCLLKGNQKY